jgi:hypothetical protein
MRLSAPTAKARKVLRRRRGSSRNDLDLAQLDDAVFVLVAPHEDVLGRGRARMKPGAFQRGETGADLDLARDRGVDAEPADEILGSVRIARGEGRIAKRVAVHHGELRAHEAPGSLPARTQSRRCRERERG